MPLCGSSACGCALTSVAATSGAINGDLPTINVAGSGTSVSPWNLTLNDAWAEEVAARLPTEWTSFTPTLVDITLGTSTQTWTKRYVGPNHMEIIGAFTIASGFSWGSNPGITVPDSRSVTEFGHLGRMPIGQVTCYDQSLIDVWWGSARRINATTIRFLPFTSDGILDNGGIESGVPFTWATGDALSVNLSFPLVAV